MMRSTDFGPITEPIINSMGAQNQGRRRKKGAPGDAYAHGGPHHTSRGAPTLVVVAPASPPAAPPPAVMGALMQAAILHHLAAHIGAHIGARVGAHIGAHIGAAHARRHIAGALGHAAR